MPYIQHVKDRKYKLCTDDPKSIKRKRICLTVEVPAELSNSERKTQLWLNKELAIFAEKIENGEIIKSNKVTLDQFLVQWKKGYADQSMGEYTRYMTNNVYRIYIQPVFGAEYIDKIKTLHLVNFFAELKRKDGKPMATNTKHNIYKVLKSLFGHAFKWRLIADNPMEGVDKPSAAKKEKREMRQRKKSYTAKEVEQVMSALYELPDRWRLYYIGVLLGGFRRGEMLAVQWDNVQFEAGGIYIEKQITFDEDGDKAEDEVKTEHSEGFVPMPIWYMEELKKYRTLWDIEKKNCKAWNGGIKQYVFHPGDGQMYYPNTPSLTWRRFLAKKELPYIRLHDLRHTTAMLLREYGADLKQIQERLRHTKLSTTSDIYMHETELISRDTADRLEVLNPKNKKSVT